MEEEAVVSFLKDHPTFFHKHLTLLEELSVPHPLNTHKVISLIERQVSLLRTSTEGYKQEFQRLVQAARDNEITIQRSKKIVSTGMNCTSLDDFSILLDDVIRNDFLIENHSLILFSNYGLDTNIPTQPFNAFMLVFKKRWAKENPYYDDLSDLEIQTLFSHDVNGANSFAIMPLLYRHQGVDQYLGVLTLASQDKDRFKREKNVLSLDYFSELFSVILQRLML